MPGPVIFTVRARHHSGAETPAFLGETVTLDEQTEYLLNFNRALTEPERLRLYDLGGELLRDDLAALSFRNFVGRAEFAGVGIEVVSTKIGPDGVSRILQEVSDLASSLIFGSRSPTAFEGIADRLHAAPVPYHQLQFVRRVMLGERPGNRLQDWLWAIERNPTRRFERERPAVSPNRVRRLDNRAVQSIFSRLERLVQVQSTVALAGSPLAQKLSFGTPSQPHFPSSISAPRGQLSFDTPENRFVRHVIDACLSLMYRFVHHPKLHNGLKADCQVMLGILEQSVATPFLKEANQLTGFHAPSQALAKADGYREVFRFWGDFTRHISLPRTLSETARLLEGRDIATLYEYWTFVKILEAVVAVTGRVPSGRLDIRRDELGESLTIGMSTALGEDFTVRFNHTFGRASTTAYSTPLRPDVTIQVGRTLHVFDAKYRLEWFDGGEFELQDDAATYKRADLYKMHTYRDAITGAQTAFAVYPGTEFVFFERSGLKRSEPAAVAVADGVGAVPLRPTLAEPAAGLRDLLRVLLIPSKRIL